MKTRSIHITNGDILAELLQEAGVKDTILPWRESYYEGPLGPDELRGEWLPLRAAYFEKVHHVPVKTFLQLSEQQEWILNEDVNAIYLWFEYDLYDQTMLSRLIDLLLTSRTINNLPEIYLITAKKYPGIDDFRGFGQLTSEQITSFLQPHRWLRLNMSHLLIGQTLWQAYASDNPHSLEQILHSNQMNASYPYAHDAFFLHLQRFPSIHNGLNQIEQHMLEQLTEKQELSVDEWYKRTSRKFPHYGMTDTVFHTIATDGASAQFPIWTIDDERVHITSFGRAVLACKQDFIITNGIDRWLGGVHLQGSHPNWRWDPIKEKLCRIV